MTSHHNSHTTTDVKPDMLSGVQTGKPWETLLIRQKHRYDKQTDRDLDIMTTAALRAVVVQIHCKCTMKVHN